MKFLKLQYLYCKRFLEIKSLFEKMSFYGLLENIYVLRLSDVERQRVPGAAYSNALLPKVSVLTLEVSSRDSSADRSVLGAFY